MSTVSFWYRLAVKLGVIVPEPADSGWLEFTLSEPVNGKTRGVVFGPCPSQAYQRFLDASDHTKPYASLLDRMTRLDVKTFPVNAGCLSDEQECFVWKGTYADGSKKFTISHDASSALRVLDGAETVVKLDNFIVIA